MQAAAEGGESLLSPILSHVAVSKTIEIHALTKAMEARGEEVVSLCVGEPDFPPPPGICSVHRASQCCQSTRDFLSLTIHNLKTNTHTEVIEATVQAVRDGATRYTAVTGEEALRTAICEDLERRKGVKYAPQEIIVGNGAKQEVYQAVLALCR